LTEVSNDHGQKLQSQEKHRYKCVCVSPARAFCVRARARYNSTLFVHERLISLHERLAFRIVKEQPIASSGETPDANRSSIEPLAYEFSLDAGQ